MQEEARHKPVVVALIDTGANPYLPVFNDRRPMTWLPETAGTISLRGEGEGFARFLSDESIWETLEFGSLYYFAGTRLLAISFEEGGRIATWDRIGHGSATSALVGREAPDVLIVMVQANTEICVGRTDCMIDASIADAMEWVSQQPWIDVVSISIGIPSNPPVTPTLFPEEERFLAASERAAREGKVIFSAAGNEVSPAIQSYFAGPPWIVAVGGAQRSTSGEALLGARAIDVVANYTERVQVVADAEPEQLSGTSLGTPIVAGTIANALHRIHATGPARNVAAEELRAALNASGTYFEPTEWEPAICEDPGALGALNCASIPVVAQPQMGWGYVDASLAPEIARRVLEQDFESTGKDQAAVFQEQWQRAREAYWDAYAR